MSRQEIIDNHIPTSLFFVLRVLSFCPQIALPVSTTTEQLHIKNKQKCRDGVFNEFLSHYRHLFVPLLFHEVIFLHPPCLLVYSTLAGHARQVMSARPRASVAFKLSRMDGAKGDSSPSNSGLGRGALALSLTLLLIQACASGDVDTVAHLVSAQKHFDPSACDESGHTPLAVACEAGHIEVVRFLMERDKEARALKGAGGTTPLHVAARGGHIAVVKYLIDGRGMDPSCEDNDGSTPLDCAQDNKMRKFLLSRGARGSKANAFIPELPSIPLPESPVSSSSHSPTESATFSVLESSELTVSMKVLNAYPCVCDCDEIFVKGYFISIIVGDFCWVFVDLLIEPPTEMFAFSFCMDGQHQVMPSLVEPNLHLQQ